MPIKSTKKENNYSSTQETAILEFATSKNGVLNRASIDELITMPVFKDKTARSLIAKVSLMARSANAAFKYETKKRQSVNGGEVVRKPELVAQIEAVVGFSVDTFEAASKVQLEKLLNWASSKAA